MYSPSYVDELAISYLLSMSVSLLLMVVVGVVGVNAGDLGDKRTCCMISRLLFQILRGNQGELLFKAMEAQHAMQNPGNLFMDAPPHVDLQDLVNQSYDKAYWKSLESFIPSHLRGDTIYTVYSNRSSHKVLFIYLCLYFTTCV